MSTSTFDTLRFTERLKAAGVTPLHAVAEAEALRDVLSEALDTTLASKSDVTACHKDLKNGIACVKHDIADVRTEIADVRNEVAQVKSELKNDIAQVRSELKNGIAELRSELKNEIAGVRSELKRESAEVKNELKAEISAVKSEVKLLAAHMDARFLLVDSMFDKLDWMLGVIVALALANFAKQFL